MKKIGIILIVITLISKVSGLFRDIALSYFYGASNISDAFLISQTIPVVIFSFIGAALATGFIPLYTQIVENSGESAGNKFTSNLINILVTICIVIIGLGMIFTKQLVNIFASGFDGDTLKLAIVFTRISLVGIIFTTLIHIFKAFLQLKGAYVITAFVSIPMNLVFILGIVISSKGNLSLIAICSVMAIGFQLVFLIPVMHKKGYRHKKLLNFNDDKFKKMLYLTLPVILGVAVNDINVLIDRTLASRINEGGISALNYADNITKLFHGIFVASIVTLMYPMISRMVVKNNKEGFKKSVAQVVTGINLLVTPGLVGTMIFAKPIVTLLFGRGSFDENSINITATALFFYSVGMLGFSLREVLSSVFYSMQDTKTPMINAAIGVAINIVLNIILSRYLGIGGLALATSISAIITTGLLFLSLRRKIGSFGMKEIISSFFKILLAALVMGVIAKVSYNYLISLFSYELSLFLVISISAILYIGIIYFMKIKDIDDIFNQVKGRLNIR